MPQNTLFATIAHLSAATGITTGLFWLLKSKRNVGKGHEELEQSAQETRDLKAQFAELEFERAAIEQAAAENIRLAEDLFFAREEAEKNAGFLKLIMDSISQAIAVFDQSGRLIKWNEQLSKLLSIPASNLEVGLPESRFNELLGPIRVDSDNQAGQSAKDSGEQEWRLSNGRILSVQRSPIPCGGYIETFTDITDRKNAEEIIWKMAHTDHLTGLANRACFTNAIEDAVAQTNQDKDRLALALIDLDKFKPVNDSFGHPTGDKLLVDVSEIIKNAIREGDIAARLGGDEFAVLMRGVKSAGDARAIAEKIVKTLNCPLTVNGHRISIGASVGIALYPDHADSPEALIAAADRALYSVKASGRGYVAVSTEGRWEAALPIQKVG
ncbi:MAG: diguanylate cyclase [Alphaproteobacteria bacterium]|nr:MAG: diguanylate cyclase [Alphaproteobacteria bacterium]